MSTTTNTRSLIAAFYELRITRNRIHAIADDKLNVKQEEVQGIIDDLNCISYELNGIADEYGLRHPVPHCKLWNIKSKNDVKAVTAYLEIVIASIDAALIELAWLINDMELPSIIDNMMTIYDGLPN